MEKYEKLAKIGAGAHGVVHKCRVLKKPEWMKPDEPFPEVVAVKKIRLRSSAEGLSQEAIRELKFNQDTIHPNVMQIIDTFYHESNLIVVMDYMECDLESIIKAPNIVLSPSDVKTFMHMALEGMAYSHKHFILHRDIKPANFLVSTKGQLRLADFGLARLFGTPARELSAQVYTLWYRPPEVLFGAQYYGAPADIWALGCIFGELIKRMPLFQGTSDLDQLSRIFSTLGTPKEADWPGMKELRGYAEFSATDDTLFRQWFGHLTADARDLLSRMLTYDPAKRITAEEALAHPYFKSAPPPTPMDNMPVVRRKD